MIKLSVQLKPFCLRKSKDLNYAMAEDSGQNGRITSVCHFEYAIYTWIYFSVRSLKISINKMKKSSVRVTHNNGWYMFQAMCGI
jgi:hypothetical protein